MNFIIKQFARVLDFWIAIEDWFAFFNFSILFSDKHNNFNICWINIEIIEEYKIFESWLKILKEPFEEYISCIVSSVKKNPLTVKKGTILSLTL